MLQVQVQVSIQVQAQRQVKIQVSVQVQNSSSSSAPPFAVVHVLSTGAHPLGFPVKLVFAFQFLSTELVPAVVLANPFITVGVNKEVVIAVVVAVEVIFPRRLQPSDCVFSSTLCLGICCRCIPVDVLANSNSWSANSVCPNPVPSQIVSHVQEGERERVACDH